VKAPTGRSATDVSRHKPPTPEGELVTQRTTYSSTWRNVDGSLSVRQYLTPQFYKTSSGVWSPIDPTLSPVAGKPRWWQATANIWQVALGRAGAGGGAEQVTLGAHTIGFAPQKVTDPGLQPSVSGDTATYRGVWPQVDLKDQVTSSGVDGGPGPRWAAGPGELRLQGLRRQCPWRTAPAAWTSSRAARWSTQTPDLITASAGPTAGCGCGR
jgi:hypothetical protein